MESYLTRFLDYLDTVNSGSAHTKDAYQRDITEFLDFLKSENIMSLDDVDRIIVMNDGQIDAIGRHEELLATNAIYQEVYEMQTQGKGEADEN